MLVSVLALLATSLVQAPQVHAGVPPICLGMQATIVGTTKADTLKGTKKADVIVGLGGSDRIIGGGGGDRICGGAGKDLLYGGLGNDHMNGGKGTDECLQQAGSGTKKSCEGPKFQLAVSKAGPGSGTVTSSPSAIDCGQTCASGFFEGEKVTLAASAVVPSTFGGWGGACTGTGSCQIVMSKAQSVTATFSAGTPAPGPSPAGPGPSCAGSPCYVVSRTGNTYRAVAPLTGRSLEGSLKFVVELAVLDLDRLPSGDVIFTAGVFDLGSDRFVFVGTSDIEFAGAGMDATVIQNSSSAAMDTEPFDMHDTDRIVIRDMTVNAGGPPKSTSDAIDFDGGNDVIIERVKIAQSRGRGIVFDGKDIRNGVPRTADRNIVRGCVITGMIPRHGIEFLASSFSRVEGCTIMNVEGHGISMNKASPTAEQPNKPSSNNHLIGNTIDRAGQDGIHMMSGNDNVLDGNVITNSSQKPGSHDGIRIDTADLVSCEDNVVRNNRATDNQATKTQRYGLNIASSDCNGTVVDSNDFSGNLLGDIHYPPPG